MRQSVKRMISSLVALLLLVGAFVVFVNFVEPAYEDVAGKRAQVFSQEEFLKTQAKITQEVRKITGSYEEGSDARQAISDALPERPDIATALLQLGGMAQIHNLAARSFSVTLPPPAPALAQRSGTSAPARPALVVERPVAAAVIRVELTGQYEDFKAFVRNIETNIRIFDVKAIAFQPVGKPTQNAYSYSVTVAAYYQNNPSP